MLKEPTKHEARGSLASLQRRPLGVAGAAAAASWPLTWPSLSSAPRDAPTASEQVGAARCWRFSPLRIRTGAPCPCRPSQRPAPPRATRVDGPANSALPFPVGAPPPPHGSMPLRGTADSQGTRRSRVLPACRASHGWRMPTRRGMWKREPPRALAPSLLFDRLSYGLRSPKRWASHPLGCRPPGTPFL